MGVVANAEDFLVVHGKSSLQLSRLDGEAVEDLVLGDAVDPLTARAERAGDELAAFSLAAAEGLDEL